MEGRLLVVVGLSIVRWCCVATTTCTPSSPLDLAASTASLEPGGRLPVASCGGTQRQREGLRERQPRGEVWALAHRQMQMVQTQMRMRRCTCWPWTPASPTASPPTVTSTSRRSGQRYIGLASPRFPHIPFPPFLAVLSGSHPFAAVPCSGCAVCADAQLSAVSSALSSFAQRRSPSFLLLLCHYPLLSPTGEDYGRTHRWHGVDNGHRMLDVLRTGLKAAYTTPLHAAAFLHGHVHKGYRVDLPLHSVAPPSLHPADGAARAAASADASSLASADPSHPPTLSVPMLDPGSSGRSFSAQHHRAAAYNLYTITWTPTAALSHDGAQQQPQQPQQPQSQPQPHHSQPGPASGSWTLQVERFVHDGTAFQREPAPYTSGY